MMRLVPLKEETEKSLILSFFSLSLCHCEENKRPSPEPHHAGTLILGCPASKSVRNKGLLFKPPSLWYFSYSSLN